MELIFGIFVLFAGIFAVVFHLAFLGYSEAVKIRDIRQQRKSELADYYARMGKLA